MIRRLSNWLFYQPMNDREFRELDNLILVVQTFRYDYALLLVSTAPAVVLFIAYSIINMFVPSHPACFPYTALQNTNLLMIWSLILHTFGPLASAATHTWWIRRFFSYLKPLETLRPTLYTSSHSESGNDIKYPRCLMYPPLFNRLTILSVVSTIALDIVILVFSIRDVTASGLCHHHGLWIVVNLLALDIVMLVVFLCIHIAYSHYWFTQAARLFPLQKKL